MDAEIKTQSDALIFEIINAVGLPKTGRMYRLFRPFFLKPAERMATIGVTLDRKIAEQGVAKATDQALTNWCRDVQARGKEHVPAEGPLLIVSNHAGAYDVFVICSQLERKDFKVISSDITFFKNLPHVLDHAIFLSDEIQDRMTATRAGIRHLQKGGSLLIFGTGLVDPDPAVYPDAEKHIERWSPSIDLFLRTALETKLLVTIVSGVLSARWAHHPITRLRRIDWQQRRLAEFSQVLQQLFFPGSLYLSPRISFAAPVSVETLRAESNSRQVLPAVIARGKALLAEHITWAKNMNR